MDYLAFASQLQLPHWLILAGATLVLFGVIGMALEAAYRPWDSQPKEDRKGAPGREDRMALPPPS